MCAKGWWPFGSAAMYAPSTWTGQVTLHLHVHTYHEQEQSCLTKAQDTPAAPAGTKDAARCEPILSLWAPHLNLSFMYLEDTGLDTLNLAMCRHRQGFRWHP